MISQKSNYNINILQSGIWIKIQYPIPHTCNSGILYILLGQ